MVARQKMNWWQGADLNRRPKAYESFCPVKFTRVHGSSLRLYKFYHQWLTTLYDSKKSLAILLGPCEKWHRNGTAMEKKKMRKYPRSDIRHWNARVYKPGFKSETEDPKTTSHYHVKIQAHGERRGVSLHTAKKSDAAKAAKELNELVRVKGWELGLQLFRGETPKPKLTVTLGEYLAQVEACGEMKPRTLRTYTTKVRTIAAFLNPPEMPDKPDKAGSQRKRRKAGASKKLSKYDYVYGGAAAWQKLVDATPLRSFTEENLSRWRKAYLAKCENNPKRLMSSTRSANSCIRAGKAIFAAEVRAKIPNLKLPDPIPFSTMGSLEEAKNKYRSQIANPEELLAAGSQELASATTQSEIQAAWDLAGQKGVAPETTPAVKIRADLSALRKQEAFKVLILGLCAGLRRGEIDALLWSQVDFSANCLWIETTDVHELKADSAGKIPLDPVIMDLLRKWKSSATDEFVVRGCAPRGGTDKVHYRANRTHEELIKWLKTKGITSRMPLHTLRKEFGSIICDQAGIHAASRLLRHASISQTAAVYADHRNKVTAGLGGSLHVPKN
jgi:integrase